MQAAIKKMTDGSVALRLDADAARAVFASVLFAARFHEGIAPLTPIAKQGLKQGRQKLARRVEICR
jgi:hypothetical protein